MAVQDWSTAFEATPAGSDQVSQGDDRIRELKETLTAELQPEHDVGDATFGAAAGNYEDTGRHVPGSARSFLQSAAPTGLWEPTDAGAMPPVDLNPDKQASSALDNGRIWVDLDDAQPYVREQVITGAAWSGPNTGEGVPGAAWVSLWPRTFTLTDVANDNDEQPAASDAREGVSSAGGIGGVLGVAVDCPADARDYEIIVTATCTYYVSAAEAIGFWLVEDSGAAADVDFKFATKLDANGITGEVTLTRLQDSPVNGTTYNYTVEFATSDHTSANCVANPDASTYGLGGAWVAGAMAGISWSRISATIKPRYQVASYFG